MQIAIVIPTIGRPKYLDQAIDSVINQIEDKFDEIVVYDNSGIGMAKADSMYAQDHRVTWFISEIKNPPITSWNNAIRLASCANIVMLGDDDIALPNMAKVCRNAFCESDVFVLNHNIIDSEGRLVIKDRFKSQSLLTGHYNVKNIVMNRRVGKCSILVPGMCFSKANFLKSGEFIDIGVSNYYYPDDYLFFRLARTAGGGMFISECCFNYRVHSESIGNALLSFEELSNTIYNYIDKQNEFLNEQEKYKGIKRHLLAAKYVHQRIRKTSIYDSKRRFHIVFRILFSKINSIQKFFILGIFLKRRLRPFNQN